MDTPSSEVTVPQTVPDRPDLEQYVSYEDGDDVVICDRTEPASWLRSDHTVTVRP